MLIFLLLVVVVVVVVLAVLVITVKGTVSRGPDPSRAMISGRSERGGRIQEEGSGDQWRMA